MDDAPTPPETPPHASGSYYMAKTPGREGEEKEKGRGEGEKEKGGESQGAQQTQASMHFIGLSENKKDAQDIQEHLCRRRRREET